MKNLIIIILGLGIVSPIKSQEWVNLKQPQVQLLGRPIKSVNSGDPVFVPGKIASDKIKLDIVTGADNINDYKERFKQFTSDIIGKENMEVQSITANNVKIHSINEESFRDGSVELNAKFAYAGVTADSVLMVLSTKSNSNVSIKKVLELLSKALVIPNSDKALSFLPDIKFLNKDSSKVVVKIKNPQVYFKALFIEYKEGIPPILISRGKTWQDYWIHFYRNGSIFEETSTVLNADKSEKFRQSKKKYPEFWGPKDDKNRLYFFEANNKDGKLILDFYLETTVSGKKIIKEIPYTISSNDQGVAIKTWELPYTKVDEFNYRDKTKIIYLACYAKQIIENGKPTNKIEILNFDDNSNNQEKIISYMKYPEVKFIYLTAKD
jgi:hypothetical protein